MQATISTKDRILDTTAEHFRRYGYTGTGMKQIVAEAKAPFGSIYHFFPGGKEQLGREVILRSGPDVPGARRRHHRRRTGHSQRRAERLRRRS